MAILVDIEKNGSWLPRDDSLVYKDRNALQQLNVTIMLDTGLPIIMLDVNLK